MSQLTALQLLTWLHSVIHTHGTEVPIWLHCQLSPHETMLGPLRTTRLDLGVDGEASISLSTLEEKTP